MDSDVFAHVYEDNHEEDTDKLPYSHAYTTVEYTADTNAGVVVGSPSSLNEHPRLGPRIFSTISQLQLKAEHMGIEALADGGKHAGSGSYLAKNSQMPFRGWLRLNKYRNVNLPLSLLGEHHIDDDFFGHPTTGVRDAVILMTLLNCDMFEYIKSQT
ncbi:hypothetical protein D9756_009944 [Leucocoprinus leucothites]|uniref:Uncharacterized protein n=1 Tax=Leucocoprinus leucothites TaxID=201217 RepID=A0A8H5CSK5_9AGAR|nr:hypothetical protein D9756_009944 [Leucoagaricus leucothites]